MAVSNPITLKLPSKYATASASSDQPPAPTTDWLTGTWTVSHSTLEMWRSARNVRISYKLLPPKADGSQRIDDLVEYEPNNKVGKLKTVTGVDTQAPDGGWDWRGKGWLFFVTSHWELIGWGEENAGDPAQTEKWAVTWFAPTFFTKEGLDVYSDRREGPSEMVYKKIEEALKRLGAKELVEMVDKDMRPVEIKLPWTDN